MIIVVIPCFRVKEHILDVLSRIGSEVAVIYLVDDGCAQQTGAWVESQCHDPRLRVLYNKANLGVGGAVSRAYRQALEDFGNNAGQSTHCNTGQFSIRPNNITVVKLDGDGQADPALIPVLVAPIERGEADYVKGNRFSGKGSLKEMPLIRRGANYLLSHLCKRLTGYRHIMDPANGLTVISFETLKRLPPDKLDLGYFFETGMLFQLSAIGARVQDHPMKAVYNNETSGLNIWRQMPIFAWKLIRS